MTRILATCLGILVLAGCGISAQDHPVPIPQADLPSPLRSEGTPHPSAPVTADPGDAAMLIYFVRADRLVGLPREMSGRSVGERLRAALSALTAGPSEKEQAAGVTTAFPSGLDLEISAVQGHRVVLGLNGETDGRSAVDSILTVGQVVLSLTSVPSIDEVAFVRDGVAVEALLPGGALTAEPLTAADYAKLKAR